MNTTQIEEFINSKLSLVNPQPLRFPIKVINYLISTPQPTHKDLTEKLFSTTFIPVIEL